MPKVRHKTLRKVVTGQAALTSDAERLRIISALYVTVYNSSESLIPQATELFHLLGEILEGTPLAELNVHTIEYSTLLRAYEDRPD